jgi:two-component system chemotaxis sensor kinase CheA
MERVARDASAALGKTIRFTTAGESCEIDKAIVDAIVDPLTHMVRNAVDHGIESAAKRTDTGKPPEGGVSLFAYHKGGNFHLEIEDDGAGLDTERILKKAIERGLVRAEDKLRESQIFDLIFHNGFSTKDEVSSVSGRGVGMDVVKTVVSRLRGSCEVRSVAGKGTRFLMRLPLTLAIFNGMVVRVGREKYIFPNSDILDVVMLDMSEVRAVENDRHVVQVKNDVIGVIDVRRILGDGSSPGRKVTALVAHHDGRRFALLVDELLSQERIVRKNLTNEVNGIPGVAGGSILKDGKVALIIEAGNLIERLEAAA